MKAITMEIVAVNRRCRFRQRERLKPEATGSTAHTGSTIETPHILWQPELLKDRTVTHRAGAGCWRGCPQRCARSCSGRGCRRWWAPSQPPSLQGRQGTSDWSEGRGELDRHRDVES